MSHRTFLASTSGREYAIYRVGEARARRKNWMWQARQHKKQGYTAAATQCVRAARENNREYLKYVREARALEPRRRAA